MADITMCKGETCTLKKNQLIPTGDGICSRRDQCRRYTAQDDGAGQVWYTNLPLYDKDKKQCSRFWDNNDRRKK